MTTIVRTTRTTGKVDEIFGALDKIPAVRTVAGRLAALAEDENASSGDLAKVIQNDPALTARLIRLANSNYYGLSRRVSNPTMAVTVVGFATVKSLALTAASGLVDNSDLPPHFWLRSATTAVGAAEVAPRCGQPPQNAFNAGLLSGVGQALLWTGDRERYGRLAHSTPRAQLEDAEIAEYGMTSLEVAARALRAWEFPADIPEALEDLYGTHAPRSLSTVVAVALELTERILFPGTSSGASPRVANATGVICTTQNMQELVEDQQPPSSTESPQGRELGLKNANVAERQESARDEWLPAREPQHHSLEDLSGGYVLEADAQRIMERVHESARSILAAFGS